MTFLALSALLAMSQPTTAPAPPGDAAAANEVAPVTVRAPDPRRALAELRRCVAQRCPPREDLRLTLRSAEASFLAGDYRTARATLDQSIRRNRAHARSHPVLMAGVYKADDTVNRHLGYGEAARRSARQARVLIGHGYGQNSSEALWARFDTADAHLNNKEFNAARAQYLEVLDGIGDRPWRRLRDSVELRLAWMPALEGRPDRARRRLEALVEDEARDRKLRLSAGLLRARLEPLDKQPAAAAAVLDRFRSETADAPAPVLLWSPQLDRRQEQTLATTYALSFIPQPSMPDPSDWMDVAFHIDRNGKVGGVQLLRAGKADAAWQREALDIVARRVYAASPRMEPEDRVFRVERLAYTALATRPSTGSRIPSRSMVPQLHATDLSRVAITRE